MRWRKRILSVTFSLIFFLAQMAIASIREEGPYLDIQMEPEAEATNFFMSDFDDYTLSYQGNVPDMIPCDGRVSSNFGYRRMSRRRARMHLGMDIAAPRGTPVYAPANGQVVFSGRKGGYGLTVMIAHNEETVTLFAHNSAVLVKEGDFVFRGQQISKVGNTGRSTGPHLHYEVRVNGKQVNPSKFF